MKTIRRITVFCGSNAGAKPAYLEAARALGAELGARGVGLVYGGGKVGLMGAVAEATLAASGHVTGVIPRGLLEREVGFTELQDLRVVDTMHERKQAMADLADAFVALPGGLGTFEELFEVLTWALLGIHGKPVALLDVAGYYAPLVAFLDHAVREGFVRPQHRALLVVASSAAELFDALDAYAPPGVERWLGRKET